MIALEDLTGALCSGRDPGLWDLEAHHHIYIGLNSACWICDEARDVCMECPVIQNCFKRAVRTRESFMIMAGLAWTNGRPRDLRKRRR